MSSSKTDGSAVGLPFGNALNDGMALARRMWGAAPPLGSGMPQGMHSMMSPTFDVHELDKRIADLRTVEHWLSLNLSMLTSSIQALEVQRNTLAAVQSFAGAMMNSVAPQPGAGASGTDADQDAAAGRMPWRHDATTSAPLTGWPSEPHASQMGGGDAAPEVAPLAPQAAQAAAMLGAMAQAMPGVASAMAPVLPPGAPAGMPINPALWWNALQDQFSRLAAAAGMPATAEAATPPSVAATLTRASTGDGVEAIKSAFVKPEASTDAGRPQPQQQPQQEPQPQSQAPKVNAVATAPSAAVAPTAGAPQASASTA